MLSRSFLFFFNDTATTEIYTLSLHDALPISYAVVTLHRPSNVDDRAVLRELLDALERLARTVAVVFPVHPRTRQRIRTHGLRLSDDGRMRLLEPLGYLEMLGLVAGAAPGVNGSARPQG